MILQVLRTCSTHRYGGAHKPPTPSSRPRTIISSNGTIDCSTISSTNSYNTGDPSNSRISIYSTKPSTISISKSSTMGTCTYSTDGTIGTVSTCTNCTSGTCTHGTCDPALRAACTCMCSTCTQVPGCTSATLHYVQLVPPCRCVQPCNGLHPVAGGPSYCYAVAAAATLQGPQRALKLFEFVELL